MRVFCTGCGRGFLVDDVTVGELVCPACTTRIQLNESPRDSRNPDPIAPAAQIVCPRCSLHFTPRAAETDGSEPGPGSATKQTVLVVEPMLYFREILTDALADDYEVLAVDNADDAKTALESGRIDLMILDPVVGLPLERSTKSCPILICTEDESSMYGDPWEALRKLGADDIVKKGMNVGEQLPRRVGALLGHTFDDEDPVENTVTSRE